MDIQTITVTNIDGSTTEHVIITNDGINFTSMPKSVYDATLASESQA